jgi:transcriptional regulator NrdR family protein
VIGLRRTPILCPTCKQPMVKVLDTRAGQGTVRRRRACPAGHTIWTKEVPILSAA